MVPNPPQATPQPSYRATQRLSNPAPEQPSYRATQLTRLSSQLAPLLPSQAMNRTIVGSVAVMSLLIAAVFVWLDARQEREYRRLIAAGDAAAARDDTVEAIEAFSGALALDPGSMIARLKRGDTHRRRGEFPSAIRDLDEAAALDATAPRPLELLGDAHAAVGRHQDAASAYFRSLTLDDRVPRLAYKLGAAYYRSGQFPQAIATLERAVALDREFAEAYYLLGVSGRDRQPFEQTEKALLRAVEINPAFAAARQELADLYESARRMQRALEQLEALAALEPTRPERSARVALAYARLGRPDSAVLTLGRAAERHPEASIVYTTLGRVWLETAESQGDRIALAKALEALGPVGGRADATSESLTLYGRALYLSGSLIAAERTLGRAVERLPIDPVAFTYLADAARRLGHAELAREATLRYQVLSPGELPTPDRSVSQLPN